MKAQELIDLIEQICMPDDEIYITDHLPSMTLNSDITLTKRNPHDEDENGGWRDINHEPIKGRPFHIW